MGAANGGTDLVGHETKVDRIKEEKKLMGTKPKKREAWDVSFLVI